MKSIHPSFRRFLSLSFVASLALIWVMAVSGCIRISQHVQSSSETPLTLEQIREDFPVADYLNVPETASDIRYSLSGYKQDWGTDAHTLENRDTYISYKISPSDLKNHIEKTTNFSETNGVLEGEQFERLPISSDTLTWRIWRRAPRWWKPLDIKRGYFIRYSYGHYETRFWVNEDDNTVLVYKH